jgi:hypothetical protein
MLIAYDSAGNVIATQDYRTIVDEDGNVLGLADYAGHEEAGGEMTDFWQVTMTEGKGAAAVVTPARGSKAWPEYLGAAAHDFRVELAGPPGQKQIVALVHKTSGHRRERHVVGNAIDGRISAAVAVSEPADLRDLVGGPDRPLPLDEHGRTRARPPSKAAGAGLPMLRRVEG